MTRAGLAAVLVDLRGKAARLACSRGIIERREPADDLFARAQLDRIKADEQRVAGQIADVESALKQLPSDC